MRLLRRYVEFLFLGFVSLALFWGAFERMLLADFAGVQAADLIKKRNGT